MTKQELEIAKKVYTNYIDYLNEKEESPVRQGFMGYVWWLFRELPTNK